MKCRRCRYSRVRRIVRILVAPSGGVRRSFAARLPSPLLGWERRHQPELVRRSASSSTAPVRGTPAPNRRHVHVNTVAYQVRRVEELAGRSLSSTADRVCFFLRLKDTGVPR
ncbi:helix-turn-helix domain-containing protein [Nonomuraea angiospora]|uniref:helix-turn-helix domain-containing protein n=1 Tax=Nonomuraea angiospora TaxID=46172 RepID=UPI0037AFD3E5